MSESHSTDSDNTTLVTRRVFSNALPMGTRLGEFEITGMIGQGGFGIVYLAHDHVLGRDVALKEYMPAAFAGRVDNTQVTILSEHYTETFMLGLQSFVKEAQLLAQFDHASLVKVYRFWEANGTAYMAMPFYEAPTLKQMLKGDYSSWADEMWLKNFIGDVLAALQVLHNKQCYHRDISPDNILMLDGRKPVLLDFGAARRVIGDMTQALTVILKPGFAPIEQYGEMTDVCQGPWTDLYALASVVYYVISGKVPTTSMSRLVSDSMVPLAVSARGRFSPQFLEALDAALSVRPEQRPQSVAEFRARLGLAPAEESFASTSMALPTTGPGSHAAAAPVTRPSLKTPTQASVRPTVQPVPPAPTVAEDLEVTVIPTHQRSAEAVPSSTAPLADAPAPDAPLPARRKPPLAAILGGVAVVAAAAVIFWPRAVTPRAPPVVATAPAAAAPVPAPAAPVAQAAPVCPLKLADGTPACPAMVALAAGSYQMGAVAGDANAAAEEFGAVAAPVAAFEIGKQEVTVEEWRLCVDAGVCKSIGAELDGKLPVTGVSWDAVQQYIAWLSEKTGVRYRLPSEAEWEYAARGGVSTTFPWGDKIGQDNAHCGQCGSHLPISGPAPVGSFKDGKGLYDVVGNVYEWVEDCWYGSHADVPNTRPAKEATSCKKRVQKGGAFDSTESDVRPIARTWGDRAEGDARVGFRIAH
jgi:formylglycine-generating enzyme required for sulfatase activity/serine/threonine protein kinase